MTAILEKCLCKAEGHLFSSRNSYVACRGAFCTASTPFCPDPATAARMWNAMMRAGRGQACEPTPDAAELARLRRVEAEAKKLRDAVGKIAQAKTEGLFGVHLRALISAFDEGTKP